MSRWCHSDLVEYHHCQNCCSQPWSCDSVCINGLPGSPNMCSWSYACIDTVHWGMQLVLCEHWVPQIVTTYVLTPSLLLTSYFPLSCSCTDIVLSCQNCALCYVICSTLLVQQCFLAAFHFGVFSRHVAQMPQWVIPLPAMTRIWSLWSLCNHCTNLFGFLCQKHVTFKLEENMDQIIQAAIELVI